MGELRIVDGEKRLERAAVVGDLERNIGRRAGRLHEPHGTSRSGKALLHHESEAAGVSVAEKSEVIPYAKLA